VHVVRGDYNTSIQAAMSEAERSGSLLVMDTSWPGYEEIPGWVVEGYSTLLKEVDAQVLSATDKHVSLAIASVGVGSWAGAVVAHYKSKTPSASVATVEPHTAACLRTSLEAGEIVPITTGDTIMCGMNCGTVSTIAWPVLREGVDISLTISDAQSHEAVQQLHANGVMAGPCGAAPLAALRQRVSDGTIKLDDDSVVVLFCTEGARAYPVPSSTA
jgi:diaminopropionate ammonia-lyase